MRPACAKSGITAMPMPARVRSSSGFTCFRGCVRSPAIIVRFHMLDAHCASSQMPPEERRSQHNPTQPGFLGAGGRFPKARRVHTAWAGFIVNSPPTTQHSRTAAAPRARSLSLIAGGRRRRPRSPSPRRRRTGCRRRRRARPCTWGAWSRRADTATSRRRASRRSSRRGSSSSCRRRGTESPA